MAKKSPRLPTCFPVNQLPVSPLALLVAVIDLLAFGTPQGSITLPTAGAEHGK